MGHIEKEDAEVLADLLEDIDLKNYSLEAISLETKCFEKFFIYPILAPFKIKVRLRLLENFIFGKRLLLKNKFKATIGKVAEDSDSSPDFKKYKSMI